MPALFPRQVAAAPSPSKMVGGVLRPQGRAAAAAALSLREAAAATTCREGRVASFTGDQARSKILAEVRDPNLEAPSLTLALSPQNFAANKTKP